MIEVENMLLETTVGRVMFNMQLPDGMPYINGQLKKKGLQNLVAYAFMLFGHEPTITLARYLEGDRFPLCHEIGPFTVQFGHGDPRDQAALLEKAQKMVDDVEKQRVAKV